MYTLELKFDNFLTEAEELFSLAEFFKLPMQVVNLALKSACVNNTTTTGTRIIGEFKFTNFFRYIISALRTVKRVYLIIKKVWFN